MDFLFTFGPAGSYFFGTPAFPDGLKWSPNCPIKLLEKLGYGRSIQKLATVSIGHDFTWFVAYERKTGGTNYAYGVYNTTSYTDLISWLPIHKTDHEVNKSFHVSLGPANSFFGLSSVGYRWFGVNESFHRNLQAMLGPDGWVRKPAKVSLGMHESYVIVWADGYVSFNRAVGTYYPGLYALVDKINERPQGIITSVVLNPYEMDQYFVMYTNGAANWNVPAPLSTILRDVIAKYAAHRAPKPFFSDDQTSSVLPQTTIAAKPFFSEGQSLMAPPQTTSANLNDDDSQKGEYFRSASPPQQPRQHQPPQQQRMPQSTLPSPPPKPVAMTHQTHAPARPDFNRHQRTVSTVTVDPPPPNSPHLLGRPLETMSPRSGPENVAAYGATYQENAAKSQK